MHVHSPECHGAGWHVQIIAPGSRRPQWGYPTANDRCEIPNETPTGALAAARNMPEEAYAFTLPHCPRLFRMT
jgi:hypothetical protein